MDTLKAKRTKLTACLCITFFIISAFLILLVARELYIGTGFRKLFGSTGMAIYSCSIGTLFLWKVRKLGAGFCLVGILSIVGQFLVVGSLSTSALIVVIIIALLLTVALLSQLKYLK